MQNCRKNASNEKVMPPKQPQSQRGSCSKSAINFHRAIARSREHRAKFGESSALNSVHHRATLSTENIARYQPFATNGISPDIFFLSIYNGEDWRGRGGKSVRFPHDINTVRGRM
jgi:hypothetical protein